MKIIIELDAAASLQPDIKKEPNVVIEQSPQSSVTNLATFVSAAPVDAGMAPSPDGVNAPTGESATSMSSGQSSKPFSTTGAMDAGAAKALESTIPMTMSDMNVSGSGEQGSVILPGSIVNIETHHN